MEGLQETRVIQIDSLPARIVDDDPDDLGDRMNRPGKGLRAGSGLILTKQWANVSAVVG